MKQIASPITVPPVALILAGTLFLAGCEEPPPPPASTSVQPAPQPAAQSPELKALMATVSATGDAQLRKLTAQAGGFSDAVDGLLREPVDERLATAQLAWEHLYGSYNEARTLLSCRALADPLQRERLQRTDPLPILPGYIDSLAAWPGSGLVNDVTVPLNRDALLEQQGATSEAEASVGFQVLQFLLFGESARPREASDFIDPAQTSVADPATAEEDKAEPGATAPAGDAPGNATAAPMEAMPLEDQPVRRRQFLRLVANLLAEDLKLLSQPAQHWGQVGQDCPARAMAETTRRLISLENLNDHEEVSGEYLAASSRTIAMKHLWQGITPWLGEDSTLLQWARVESPMAADQLIDLGVPDTPDIEVLQRLHAALTTVTGGH